MERTRQMSMLLTLVISAVLLAIASFIGILLVSNRPDPTPTIAVVPTIGQPIAAGPPGQVIVEGMNVVLNPDPNQWVYTSSEGPPGQGVVPLPPATIDPALQPQVPTATFDPNAFPSATPPIIVEPPVATLPPPAPAAPTRDPNPVIFIQYTVQSGDSLYSIAAARNSSIELMALHGIDNNDLVPGQVLNLPIANPAYCPGQRAYVVRDADTLTDIAAVFNTTVEQLRAMNGIGTDNLIRSTQVICVP
jgi:LysM repeat protein